jgi:HK97 family phage prohead protease
MSKKVKSPRVERRANRETIEVRTNADGSKSIRGIAIPFNSKSVDLGGFVEIVSPTALDRTLKETPDVLLLRQHDEGTVMSRTTSGTLKLTVTKRGLEFEANLSAKSTLAMDTADAISRGDLDAMSFGFNIHGPEGDDWADVKGQLVRTLRDIDLAEISCVSWPAYKASSVSLRSCPPALRSLAKRDDDDDCPDGKHYDEDLDECVDDDEDRDDGDEDGEDCPCDCDPCQDGDCTDCINDECDSEVCSPCPMQDSKRSDTVRIRSLFVHRRNV